MAQVSEEILVVYIPVQIHHSFYRGGQRREGGGEGIFEIIR